MQQHGDPSYVKGAGAQPWIKMRTNLWDDPRVCDLCDRLGTDEAHVIGALYRVWAIADGHSTDGFLPGMTAGAIDRKTGMPGFATTLDLVGWLLISDDGVTIPDFDIHNGQSAKRRAQNSARQQACRARQQPKSKSSRSGRDASATGSRQQRDASATRKEERKERTTQTPPPPDDAQGRREWAEVEEALESTGMGAIAGTIAMAQARNYTTAEVMALVAHWKSRPGAWDGPGAIFSRIEHSAPGRPVADGWPDERETQDGGQADKQRRLLERCSGHWSRLGQSARAELARQAGTDPDHVQGRTLAELLPEVRNALIEQLQRHRETTSATSTSKPEARVKPAPDCEAGEDVAANDSRAVRREGIGTRHEPV